MIILQQHLRRRRPARDDLLQRLQIARLVAVIAVAEIAPLQPRLAQREALLREIEHHAPADLRRKPGARHVIAQLLPLLRAPVLHQIPRGIERGVVVQNADPECRQRGQPRPWP